MPDRRCGTCGLWDCDDPNDRDLNGRRWGECIWEHPLVVYPVSWRHRDLPGLRSNSRPVMMTPEDDGVDCLRWRPREERGEQ
jgi:hypothetical protein